MRALNFVRQGRLEWHDAPEPRLGGDGEALVRPVSVATCDLDLWLVRGVVPADGPFPFGHEGVAEVIEIAAGVETVQLGDLVSVPFQISCGECDTFRRGHTGNCERVERMAMYGLPMGTNKEFAGEGGPLDASSRSSGGGHGLSARSTSTRFTRAPARRLIAVGTALESCAR